MLLNEFIDVHVAPTDSNHKFVLDDLRKYLLAAKHVESIAQSGHRQLYPSEVDVLGEQLIDLVTRDSFIPKHERHLVDLLYLLIPIKF